MSEKNQNTGNPIIIALREVYGPLIRQSSKLPEPLAYGTGTIIAILVIIVLGAVIPENLIWLIGAIVIICLVSFVFIDWDTRRQTVKDKTSTRRDSRLVLRGNVFFTNRHPAEDARIFVLGVDRQKETDSTGFFEIEVNDQESWLVKAIYEDAVTDVTVKREDLSKSVYLTLPQKQPSTKTPIGDFEDLMYIELTVWSEVDTEIYVDGEFLMKVDHASGFDYAGGRVNVHPQSKIFFKSPSFEITKSAAKIVNLEEQKCEIRIGTQRFSDIIITDQQKRDAMGTKADIPQLIEMLLNEVSSSVRYTAAKRLGYIGDNSAVPALIEALKNDPDAYVKARIALALGQIGDVSAIPILQDEYENYDRKPSYGDMFESALRDLEFIEQRSEKGEQ